LKPNSNVIDVGCNRGSILQEILRLSPEGKHYAFEPIPRLHKLLTSRFPQVKCHQIALSDKKGEIEFSYFTKMDGFSGLLQRTDVVTTEKVEKLKVKTDTLDAIIPANLKIDLIKIDVEGAEYLVLKGSEKLLKKYQPVIIFECGLGGLPLYGHTPFEIFTFLSDLGFQINILEDFLGSPLSLESFVQEFEQNVHYMFVAYARSVA
jgi:FkbM family methyltransferase